MLQARSPWVKSARLLCDVPWEGTLAAIGHGNDAFIFPELGMGAILSDARKITDGMARTFELASYTRPVAQSALRPSCAGSAAGS